MSSKYAEMKFSSLIFYISFIKLYLLHLNLNPELNYPYAVPFARMTFSSFVCNFIFFSRIFLFSSYRISAQSRLIRTSHSKHHLDNEAPAAWKVPTTIYYENIWSKNLKIRKIWSKNLENSDSIKYLRPAK